MVLWRRSATSRGCLWCHYSPRGPRLRSERSELVHWRRSAMVMTPAPTLACVGRKLGTHTRLKKRHYSLTFLSSSPSDRGQRIVRPVVLPGVALSETFQSLYTCPMPCGDGFCRASGTNRKRSRFIIPAGACDSCPPRVTINREIVTNG